jgi:hypothetical protein
VVAKVELPGVADPLGAWRWLTGQDVEASLVTALGDVFTVSTDGSVSFLDTYEGTFGRVASSEADWRALLSQPALQERWFTPALLIALRRRGLRLSSEESYSPIRPLILGGTMDPENFEITQWRVHIGIMGQIYEQLRDVPEGTPVKGLKVEP